MGTELSNIRFLTDTALKLIDAREFKAKCGITKTDYRVLRSWYLAGIDPFSIRIFCSPEKVVTKHEFCQAIRNIDVIYVTRLQVERE